MRRSCYAFWRLRLLAIGVFLLLIGSMVLLVQFTASPSSIAAQESLHRPQSRSGGAPTRMPRTQARMAGAPAAGDHHIYLAIVRRPAQPPVIASFSASPASIAPGGASTLRWSVSGATSLSISPGVGTVTGSSISVRPARTTQFTLVATNADGAIIARTPVVVTGGSANSTGFLFLPSSGPSEDSSVVIDPTGGIHVAYASFKSGRSAAYAYCPTNCANVNSWTGILIGDVGLLGGYIRLALDTQGRPRMIWYRDTGLSDGTYYYAACDQGCTSAANWKAIALASTPSSPGFTSRYFALDQLGRPRFLYDDDATNHTGTYYGYCNTACTSISNWFEGQFDSTNLFGDYSLVFDASGPGRVALSDSTGSQRTLDYFECDTACSNGDNWFGAALYDLNAGASFTLQLDSHGRPRIGFYAGSTSSARLAYASCNADCIYDTGWHAYSLDLPEDYGGDVDLVLDSHDRPRMAYHVIEGVVPERLGYSWCNLNCETASPVWQSRFVETDDEINARVPVPPTSGCSLSFWTEIGWHPSLALDPLDTPRIGYNAVHSQGGICPIYDDIKLVRFALFNQP